MHPSSNYAVRRRAGCSTSTRGRLTESGHPLRPFPGRSTPPGGGMSVAVGAKPQPGNWIATSGTGPMTIVLTLYDTPLLGGTGLADAVLPQVIRGACDA